MPSNAAYRVMEITPRERPGLERHFLALAGEDRRLRFGAGMSDEAIREYVGEIDFGTDTVFGILGEERRVLAAAHMARGPQDAELGVSVLAGHRGGGFGAALLRRAHHHARKLGLRELYLFCLTENGAMMRLARRQGMKIVCTSGQCRAALAA